MYTPTLYDDDDLDQGVALAGGGYPVQWGEFGNSYWKTPTPSDVYYQRRYVLNWQEDETIKVPIAQLQNYVREGNYLDKTLQLFEDSSIDVQIWNAPVVEEGETEEINWFFVSIDGINTASPDLNRAVWEAIGIWGVEHLLPEAEQGYLKLYGNSLEAPAVLLVDENNYLVL